MNKIKAGDIIQNERGWQGRVVEVTHSKRFGTSYLVQYASQRQWEYTVFFAAPAVPRNSIREDNMKRIQRKRTKEWKMSEQSERQVVYVGRPTKWGNPFAVKDAGSAARAVELYQDWIEEEIRIAPENLEEIRRELGGKDLACWCPLDQPCHADVLLELANGAKE